MSDRDRRHNKAGTHWKPNPNAERLEKGQHRKKGPPERRETMVTVPSEDGRAVIKVSEQLTRVRRFSYSIGRMAGQESEKHFVPWLRHEDIPETIKKLQELKALNDTLVEKDQAEQDAVDRARDERTKSDPKYKAGQERAAKIANQAKRDATKTPEQMARDMDERSRKEREKNQATWGDIQGRAEKTETIVPRDPANAPAVE